jgi:hypothetical protein
MNEPRAMLVYRPAKGWNFIYSVRRQLRKKMAAAEPRLRSGRQWVKARKAAQRRFKVSGGAVGFHYFDLPTYEVAK